MLPEVLAQHESAVRLSEALGDAVTGGGLDRGGAAYLEVDAARLVAVLRYCKDHLDFERLSAVTAVDWYPQEARFEVVYQLHSIERNERLRIKTRVGEDQTLESAYSVWRSADWFEREVFDLFGIAFENHPNLKRILMPEGWDGHPLRKDYPIHGFKYSYADE